MLLVALFGFQSIFAVPVQLTPEVTRPVVSVETVWVGANPQEVEREIVEPQEDELKSLEGLVSLKSESSPNIGRVILEFAPGTNIDTAMLRVNNKLNQVRGYPAEAERPVIAAAGARDNAIAWFIVRALPGSGIDPTTQRDFVEDVVESRFERVSGVAAANSFGGQEREVLVKFSPEKLAEHGLTIRQVADRIAAENRDWSAGHLDEAKRRYQVRTLGQIKTPAEFESIVLREDLRERVYLRDVASVALGFKDPEVVVRYKGERGIALNAQSQSGSNVLDIMRGLRIAVDELNAGALKTRGLEIVVAYDSSLYVEEAIDLVQENALSGSLLAVVTLWVFLRSMRPTLIIAVSIPISFIGTFLCIFALGRNINVVTLAGLAFASGMVVDAANVVLENIFARMERGEDRLTASIKGTSEVWSAVFASTLTTVLVFLPIFFIEAEIGQLFRDLAIAISAAVMLSCAVAFIVIPVLSARWMSDDEIPKSSPAFAVAFVAAVERLTRWILGTSFRRLAVSVALVGGTLVGSWFLVPAAEYLPNGTQNLLFGILIPPSGYNFDEFERIGRGIEADLAPLWTGPDAKVANFFYVAFGRQVFMGIGAVPGYPVAELREPVQAALSKVPGMIAVVVQAGLFDQGLSGGNSVELQLQGPDLERLVELGGRAFFSVLREVPGAPARPVPGLELGQPELQILPDRKRLAEAGLDVSQLGFLLDVLGDGAKVSEFKLDDGTEVDVTLRGDPGRIRHTQDLDHLPIHTPLGEVVPVASLARVVPAMGPDQINRAERQRTLSIVVNPPANMPLETLMKVLEEKVAGPMVADGSLGFPYTWRLSGSADKLTATREALQMQFVVAVLVVYLLMASMYESFLLPFVVIFSVPLASVGGFAALRLVDRFVSRQNLDVISMLGFVLLVGTIVNSAILLVERALQNQEQRGLSDVDAIAEAVSSRIRPIFMTQLTTVTGLFPMIFIQGPGSELYRGIGAVVSGGLFVGTVFTLVLIPALLGLAFDLRRAWSRMVS